jgi:hypothetical protein
MPGHREDHMPRLEGLAASMALALLTLVVGAPAWAQGSGDVDTLFSINPDGSRNAIHPADVSGRFQRRKNVFYFVLIAIYLVMPWLRKRCRRFASKGSLVSAMPPSPVVMILTG